jgi:hypothetical protein
MASSNFLHGRMSFKRAVLVLVGVIAALVVLAVLAMTVSGSGYEVRDATVPYDASDVKQVRVADSLTLYVDSESQPTTGWIIGMALLVLATAAFMTALVLRMAGRRGHLVAFYAVTAAGIGFAALDELYAIHETTGHNLQFLADLPGVSRPDDVLTALYILPAAAFAYHFRDVLMSVPRAALALAAALGFFAVSVVFDIIGKTTIESLLELCSGLCITACLVLLMHTHLRQNVRPGLSVADRELPDRELTVLDQRTRERTTANQA